MNQKNIFLSFLFVAFIIVGCNNTDDMLLSYQHTVQVGLYSRSTHNDTTLTSVQVYGIGREDSLLYDVESVSSLFLNMNMNADNTQYVFKTQTLQDELFFSYRKRLSPVSGSGGITMELTLDSVGHTSVFVDSVAITYAEVNYNESRENVQIFVY